MQLTFQELVDVAKRPNLPDATERFRATKLARCFRE
jgi:hypothetical protein